MELVIALVVAGALLFVAEIYLPGFIAAKLGIMSLTAAVILGLYPLRPTVALGPFWNPPLGWSGWGGFAYMKLFTRTATASGLVSLSTGATPPPAHLNLLNQIGETLSPLRPGGTAQFGDERIDVVSDGSAIEVGQKIRVILVEGHRVVVRPV